MTFMAWTACPAAPFIRLSMAEITTRRVPDGVAWGIYPTFKIGAGTSEIRRMLVG